VTATTFIPTKTNKEKNNKPLIPGTPSISVISKSYFDGNYALNWTIPVNSILGDTVQLYENGKLISEKAIDQKSGTKGGTFTITNNTS
jgi:hypothetical protein